MIRPNQPEDQSIEVYYEMGGGDRFVADVYEIASKTLGSRSLSATTEYVLSSGGQLTGFRRPYGQPDCEIAAPSDLRQILYSAAVPRGQNLHFSTLAIAAQVENVTKRSTKRRLRGQPHSLGAALGHVESDMARNEPGPVLPLLGEHVRFSAWDELPYPGDDLIIGLLPDPGSFATRVCVEQTKVIRRRVSAIDAHLAAGELETHSEVPFVRISERLRHQETKIEEFQLALSLLLAEPVSFARFDVRVVPDGKALDR